MNNDLQRQHARNYKAKLRLTPAGKAKLAQYERERRARRRGVLSPPIPTLPTTIPTPRRTIPTYAPPTIPTLALSPLHVETPAELSPPTETIPTMSTIPTRPTPLSPPEGCDEEAWFQNLTWQQKRAYKQGLIQQAQGNIDPRAEWEAEFGHTFSKKDRDQAWADYQQAANV
jgi:hypothetical protein